MPSCGIIKGDFGLGLKKALLNQLRHKLRLPRLTRQLTKNALGIKTIEKFYGYKKTLP
jgi:hypothetical protein